MKTQGNVSFTEMELAAEAELRRDQSAQLQFELERALHISELERRHAAEVAERFPDLAVAGDELQSHSAADEGLDLSDSPLRLGPDEINRFFTLANKPGEPLRDSAEQEELISLDAAFREDWFRQTEPIIGAADASDPGIEVLDTGPESIPYSNVRLQTIVRPTERQRFSAIPAGSDSRSVGKENEHIGHFSRIGNIRGTLAKTWVQTWCTHRLYPRFVTAMGGRVRGTLEIWVELECDRAQTSCFLAHRDPAKRSGNALVQAWSLFGYVRGTITDPPRVEAYQGRHVLWTTKAELDRFNANMVAKVEHQRPHGYRTWMVIRTNEVMDVNPSKAATMRWIDLALYDVIFTHAHTNAIVYQHIYNLWRLKQAVVVLRT